eukprot:TRINITY_DN23816_c0_g1_i1.p1 TRINITY_DN23816_c0_g1~~TRINITY_DN23816_c0_g1_i1.p1  ORF type:complete len:203 (+),score=63.04 TRINITY_DN23816_c0_g1_i1:96-704(+)
MPYVNKNLTSLPATDLVRLFGAFVRLDYYDSKLVHNRLCNFIARKISQLQGHTHFTRQAELLNYLSLLPGQSHKSAELALDIASLLRSGALEAPRSWSPEPTAAATAAAALVQLEQRDEELLGLLAGYFVEGGVAGFSPEHAVRQEGDAMSLATDAELAELRKAFEVAAAFVGEGECATVLRRAMELMATELERRGADPHDL